MTKSIFSNDPPIFGRNKESSQFETVLTSAAEIGKVVLVVGQAGIGKSTILRKFRWVAENHSMLDCSTRIFELGELDNPETFLEILLHEIFGMIRHSDGKSWIKGPNWEKKLETLFGALNLKSVADLFISLTKEKWVPNWQSLLGFFSNLSEKMPEERRIVFFIDPKPKLMSESGAAWFPIIERLPPKFILVFAQLPDDAIVSYPNLRGLNIERIPENFLDVLDPVSTREYIEAGLSELGILDKKASEIMQQYGGWPYALRYALQSLKTGISIEDLPEDPGGFIDGLIKRLSHIPKAEHAISIIYGLAVLQVPVTMSDLAAFLEIPIAKVRIVVEDPLVTGFIRRENGLLELFHNLFSLSVRKKIKEDGDWECSHNKAIDWFEGRLQKNPNDTFALRRLAIHVREVKGIDGYMQIFDRTSLQRAKLGLYVELRSELENAIHDLDDPRYKAAFLNNLGIVYQFEGKYDSADKQFKEAQAINKRIRNSVGVAGNLSGLGLNCSHRREFSLALKHYKKALYIYEKLNDRTGEALVLNRMATTLQDQHKYETAEIHHNNSLEIYRELGDIEGIADCLGNLGILYKNIGNIEAALKSFNENLLFEKKMGRKIGLCTVYCNLGTLYKEQGKLELATKQIRKGLVIAEELDQKPRIAACFRDLGSILLEQGLHGDAEEMLKRALSIDRELELKGGIASDLFYMGTSLSIQGKFSEAEILLIESLGIDERLGKEEAIVTTCNNLAFIYMHRKNYSAAIEMLKKILMIERKQMNSETLAETFAKLGVCYLEQNDFLNAKDTLEKSYKIYEALENRQKLEGVKKLLDKVKNN